MSKHTFVPLSSYREYPQEEMKQRAADFYLDMTRRRTVRDFSDRDVPREIIENCIRAAGTAPSGANMQPWQFVVVGKSEMRKKIRKAAEEVESDFYLRRAPKQWLEALAPLGTDEHKDYLEKAPYIIVVFSVRHTIREDGNIVRNYYLSESVGIATGLLITALHNAGLVCLTHTPHPMSFLRDLLERPKTDTPFLILVTGYPGDDARVPDISKKSLNEIATFID